MKRLGVFIFAVVLGLSCGFAASKVSVEAASQVKIDKVHFPSKIFRKYVKQFDTDKNGYLSGRERKAAKKIELEDGSYSDMTGLMEAPKINLKGIEYFTHVTTLRIDNYRTKNLKFSKMNNLKTVYFYRVCREDKTEGDKVFDFTGNLKLEDVSVRQTNVDRVIFTRGNKIKRLELSVRKSSLSRLDKVEELHLSGGWKEVDLSKCKALKKATLVCKSLETLDFRGCPALENLEVMGGKLSAINLSGNAKLKYLYLYRNNLTRLDLSQNRELEELYCFAGNIRELDVSANKKLRSIDCALNPIEELDISMLSNLRVLDCENNRLSSLDISRNKNIGRISCRGNRLQPIDTSGHSADLIIDDRNQMLPAKDEISDGGVIIDKAHFPDYALRYIVLADFDTNHDGVLSGEESLKQAKLNLRKYHADRRSEIDCTGMEYLKGITEVKFYKDTVLLNNIFQK